MATTGIAIAGEFNIFTAADVRERILAALDTGAELEIDLAQVTELDSAAIQTMVAAQREAAANGKGLRFTGIAGPALDTLKLCNLADHFGAKEHA